MSTKLTLAIIIIIATALVIPSMLQTQQAFALSKFFNCMTEIANNHHELSITDVDNCYHKEFHG